MALKHQDEFEKQLNDYQLLYGVRMAKVNKRYKISKEYRDKQNQLENQKKDEQVTIYGEFIDELKTAEVPQMKTREQEKYNKKQKKRYFRETKVYQNDYILQL